MNERPQTPPRDLMIHRFRESAAEDAQAINRGSRCARVVPRSFENGVPSGYMLLLKDIEHFVKLPGEEPRVVADPLVLDVGIPDDYLHSYDEHLFMRIAHVLTPVYHPNVGAGMTLCLGVSFRCGTRFRVLVQQLWAVLGGGRFSTVSPLNVEACDFFIANIDRVRALKAEPLFRDSGVKAVRRSERPATCEESEP